ncbi:hypothetical protein PPYR_07523 [Photinus pyralis]|uniref:Protein krueppel n=2 Tax=Photinus pyralis TaxID=7054 RepID=A0A1Y1MTU5_PHOPY|nr:zinc finger protein 69 homolog [Photinus pyralis]KAB0799643.1 hypothetical protein PPYR_07523 [Photinus pyralis]
MDNICRTCLKVSDNLTSIFEDALLSYKIGIISSVKVSADDDLPSTICELCIRNVHLLYDFRNVIITSNATLLKRRGSLPERNNEVVIKCESNVLEQTTDEYIKLDCIDSEFDDEMPELQKPYVQKAIMKAEERKLSGQKIKESRKKRPVKKPVPHSVCNVCGVTIRSDNLNKHILIHIEDPVNCTVCGKTCKNSESLRSHMIMHRGITYSCKICTKVYKHRGGLIAHRKRHAAGGAKTVPCSICGKLFYDKQVLQKHIRSHTGERPYPCKYCNKGFSSLYARNTHTRQHTNERPYACQFCGAAFHQKVSLKTHFQSKHPTEVDALNSL